jgi:hypothetical protein
MERVRRLGLDDRLRTFISLVTGDVVGYVYRWSNEIVRILHGFNHDWILFLAAQGNPQGLSQPKLTFTRGSNDSEVLPSPHV